MLLHAGTYPVDGPEWTPEGDWIWFNGELDIHQPGTAKLFRIRPDGSTIEQMTFGSAVDWFPHPSPNGKHVLFLRYQAGTIGHPSDQLVRLCLIPAGGGPVEELVAIQGGQGTINVPSWSPDSLSFAYAAYPDLS